eukprot:2340956-Prymnesium_polylepis.1
MLSSRYHCVDGHHDGHDHECVRHTRYRLRSEGTAVRNDCHLTLCKLRSTPDCLTRASELQLANRAGDRILICHREKRDDDLVERRHAPEEAEHAERSKQTQPAKQGMRSHRSRSGACACRATLLSNGSWLLRCGGIGPSAHAYPSFHTSEVEGAIRNDDKVKYVPAVTPKRLEPGPIQIHNEFEEKDHIKNVFHVLPEFPILLKALFIWVNLLLDDAHQEMNADHHCDEDLRLWSLVNIKHECLVWQPQVLVGVDPKRLEDRSFSGWPEALGDFAFSLFSPLSVATPDGYERRRHAVR